MMEENSSLVKSEVMVLISRLENKDDSSRD